MIIISITYSDRINTLRVTNRLDSKTLDSGVPQGYLVGYESIVISMKAGRTSLDASP